MRANLYPVHHSDGTPDKRYTISHEGTGDRRARYVARFCGDWINSAASYQSAVFFAVTHKQLRLHGPIEAIESELAQARADTDRAIRGEV